MNEETIFAAALEKSPAERTAYLAEACRGDDALRRRLEGLLAASERVGSFMANPAVGPAVDLAATETLSASAEAVAANRGASAANADEEPLTFLSPSTRPDSLGRIGHYEVLQVLGKGGFGIVFRAFDDVLQRVVAVKVMAPQLAATSPARKRFLREARTSAAVRHENVVQVYEVAEQPLPYLAMEFIPGETLQQRLDRTGPLDVPEVLRIGRQIAEGLAAAHATDLIHRDIKPSNVLIEGGQQRVKITDFGLARAADDASISQSGIIAGTPMYMAPEQAQGQPLDQRADLFSLGSVLYQMVAGRPPFRANTTVAVLKRVAEDTPRDIREIIPETPQWLCDIITKLHAKNPDERYQSAREAADVLADCERQLQAHRAVKDTSRIPKRRSSESIHPSRRRKWAVTALMCLLLGGVGFVLLVRKGPLGELLFPTKATVSLVWRESPGKRVSIQLDAESAGMHGLAGPGSETDVVEAEAGADGARSFHVTRRVRAGHQVLRAFENGIEFHTQPVLLFQGKNYEFIIPDPPSLRLSPPKPPEIGWVQLFNGQDLAGWKVFPADRQSWKVVDGVLTGHGEPSHLFSERGNFRDFHLRMETRVSKAGVCGQFIRIPFGDPKEVWKIHDDGALQMSSVPKLYAADMKQPNVYLTKARAVWGIGSRAATEAVPDHEWFTQEIIADGRYMTTRIDWQASRGNTGKFTKHEEAYFGTAPEGHIALQLFDPNSMVEFRKIEIKELPAVPSAKQEPPRPPFTNNIGMEFVLVPKGKSWLGGGSGVVGAHGVEPVHEVEIAQDFYLGKFEVTQEEWQKVMGKNPSSFFRTGAGKDSVKDVADAELARFPVDNVSWDDCQEFITRLNERSKENGWVYRLPKQSEWEYACRGGPLADKLDSTFDFYGEKPTNRLRPDQANILGKGRTCKVGSYKPNRLGLHDMHGNVWEWCEDAFDVKDPALASLRAIRGGCWVDDGGNCRAAVRHGTPPSLRSHYFGLRLARVPSGALSPEVRTPHPPDPERRAAEYVLSIGGTVQVNQQSREIGAVGNLPRESFQLTCVVLEKNKQVTDAGLAHFKDCKNLRTALLQGTQVTDAGLGHLAGMGELTELNLARTRVTAKGVKGLAMALPKCKIAWDGGVIEPK